MRKSLGMTLGGLILMGLGWKSSRQFESSTILYFLPPSPPATRESKTDSFIEASQGWSNPAELARSLLEAREVSEGLNQFLSKQKDPDARKALESSYLLWEQNLVQVQALEPQKLEIRLSGSVPAHLRLYTSGLLEHLHTTLHRLSARRRSSTQIEVGLTESQEALELAEEKLVSIVAAPQGNSKSQSVATGFGLEHYQEDFASRLSWQQKKTRWESMIEQMSPRFVTLSGPDIRIAESSPLKFLMPIGILLCLVGAVRALRKPEKTR